MDVREVRRFDLQGRDEEHLRQRLMTFRLALHARNGSVIEVRWGLRATRGGCDASVVYELPAGARVAAAQSDAPQAGAR